jgi:Domain of unknown function (DUF4032)/Lipopolysaccharide kinase (Kdo/WaaP) family
MAESDDRLTAGERISGMTLRQNAPNFGDLPWESPLSEWGDLCERLEDAPHGVSRHPVVFVNYAGKLYALKELPEGMAEQEYELLRRMSELHLPAVQPVGHAQTLTTRGVSSVLITRYLDSSLPYRSLFTSESLKLYRQHLLDAIAGLLVQLHLAGIYWGDCSLSNTLFRRDAGALRAYLVDAETSEVHPGYFPPTLRLHDLQIMEENVDGELLDLHSLGLLMDIDAGIPVGDTGAYISRRYQHLWDEITREDIISPEEHYRIQERIRALNQLGFSVGDVKLTETEGGHRLRLKFVVTDRNFHRDQLSNLTGLDAEEMQAQKMMNEIHELRATLSRDHHRSTPLSVAAYHWLENYFNPASERLKVLISGDVPVAAVTGDHPTTLAELYCQMLENKWYLSEQAHHDVGHQAALEDLIQRFWLQKRFDL